MKIGKPLFHVVVCTCLTAITITAMCIGQEVIAGTALGALGGYVIKNGVFNNNG